MRRIILLSFLNILFICACKKSDTQNSSNNLTGKIKTITYTTDFTPTNTSSVYYYYNTDGTLNNTKISDGISFIKKDSFSYNYFSNKTIINTYDALGYQTYKKEIFFDALNRVDSFATLYIPSNTVGSTKVIYNANSEPIKTISYNNFVNGTIPTTPTNIYVYEYNNGNMVKREQIPTTPNTTFQSYFIYEYYSDVSNLTPDIFGDPLNLIYNLNLVKSEISVTYTPGNSVLDNSWSYTFDSNNRVLTETLNSISNGIPDGHYQKRTFTYY